MNIGCIYVNSLKEAGKKNKLDQARFSLKNLSHAQVLFFSGAKDMIWPSASMVEELLRYNHDFANVRHLIFDHAGHALFAAHADIKEKSVILFGDTTEDTSKYVWSIMLAFLSPNNKAECTFGTMI